MDPFTAFDSISLCLQSHLMRPHKYLPCNRDSYVAAKNPYSGGIQTSMKFEAELDSSPSPAIKRFDCLLAPGAVSLRTSTLVDGAAIVTSVTIRAWLPSSEMFCIQQATSVSTKMMIRVTLTETRRKELMWCLFRVVGVLSSIFVEWDFGCHKREDFGVRKFQIYTYVSSHSAITPSFLFQGVVMCKYTFRNISVHINIL